MVSSEKRARRAAHGHARARACAPASDTSGVAENSATRRKTRLRSHDEISSVKLYDVSEFSAGRGGEGEGEVRLRKR